MGMPNVPSDILNKYGIDQEELVKKAVDRLKSLDYDEIKDMNRDDIIKLFYKCRDMNRHNISNIMNYEHGIKEMLREYRTSSLNIDPKLIAILLTSITEIKKHIREKDIISKEILTHINKWNRNESDFNIEIFILFILLVILIPLY